MMAQYIQGAVRALLGGMLYAPATYTHDPAGTGLRVPSTWTFNPYKLVSRSAQRKA